MRSGKEERIGIALSIRTKPPTFWKLLAGAIFALVLLILVWLMFDVHILRPNPKKGHEALDVAIWTLPPTFAVTLIFGVAWQKATNQVRSMVQEPLEGSDGLIGEAARSDFLLEVIGLSAASTDTDKTTCLMLCKRVTIQKTFVRRIRSSSDGARSGIFCAHLLWRNNKA